MEISTQKFTALDWIEAHQEEAIQLSDTIWNFAEPALREYRSARAHVEFMRNHGFEVEVGIAGLPTAYVATYGTGRPVIGFFAEYDATPGNSQMPLPYRAPVNPFASGFDDTHNGLGAGSLASAVAVKETMKKFHLPGTLKVFGTPAEKISAGKVYQARAGYYDGLDAVLGWHPRAQNTVIWNEGPHCGQVMIFEFQGVAVYGHRPWGGISALDGVILMNVMVSYMKEHIPREFLATVTELISNGGQSPSNLPEYSQIWYTFRAQSRKGIEEISLMLQRCAEAAALATGCKQKHRIVGATRPWLPNHAMADLVYQNLEFVGPPKFSEEDKVFARKIQENIGLRPMEEPFDLRVIPPTMEVKKNYSWVDDITEFCWSAPTGWLAITYMFDMQDDLHKPSWATAALAKTNVAHQSLLTAAKVLALSAIELLTNPSELEKARTEYSERTKTGLLPVAIADDVQPPIDAIYSFPPFYPEDWTIYSE
jgi:aminobenzoyl-glutamate utilization protein B